MRAGVSLIAGALLLAARLALAAPEDFVEVAQAVPGVVVELRYATAQNFLKRAVYPDGRAWLRRGTAEKLARAQAELQKRGLGLKVWDAFRPRAVQREMWKLVPNADCVADPEEGSRHNRGAAVDVTLVDAQGRELPMPTGFDDFSKRAAAAALGAPREAAINRTVLQQAMLRSGFTILDTEWWHFDDEEWPRYPVEETRPAAAGAAE